MREEHEQSVELGRGADLYRLLAGLRELAEYHAEPEICDHLVVYRNERLLLEAYDAGDNTVWVAADLPPATLAGLRRALGLE